MIDDLEQYIAVLARLPTFNIYAVDAQGGITPWYEVTMAQVVNELAVHESNLAHEVSAISVQLMHWGRLEALARRVWQIEERRYRVWRDKQVLTLAQPPKDADAKVWKKPTEAVIEASYRTHKQYGPMQAAVERAEEAYTCAQTIRQAFAAKKDMLKVAVMRSPESSAPRLAV